MNEADADRPAHGLRAGLLTNYAAFGIVAASGLAVNFVVLAAAGTSALGLYSQAYVVFILMAQLATAGVHHAVLQTVAHRGRDNARGWLRSALRVVAITAVTTAVVTALLAPLLASVLDSDDLRPALLLVALALPLHAANKVIASYTNALGSMHRFALLQSLRGVATVATVGVVAGTGAASWWFAAALPVSEAIVIAAGLAVHPRVGRSDAGPDAGRHLIRFGRRAALGGLVQEASTRVDVIVLALLVSDAEVGIFTVAATLVEGCYQLLAVLRNNLNPVLASAVASGGSARIEATAAALRWRLWCGAAVCWVGVAALGRPVARFVDAPSLEQAWAPLVIMLGCLVLAAPLLPFDQLLLVGGRPGMHSSLMGATVVANAIGNVALVPVLGIEGAATSTGLSYLALAGGIWWTARRTWQIDLFARRVR